MAGIDYEAEYNNRARVPDHPEIFARWAREAEEYRLLAMEERRAELGLAYSSTQRQFIDLLHEAGFVDASIEPTRVYAAEDAAVFLRSAGLDADEIAPQIDGRFVSAFVRATKPAVASEPRTSDGARRAVAAATPEPEATSCCGPECCSSAA